MNSNGRAREAYRLIRDSVWLAAGLYLFKALVDGTVPPNLQLPMLPLVPLLLGLPVTLRRDERRRNGNA